jgi:16S rRNA (guanine527-N7)-methyltransferase
MFHVEHDRPVSRETSDRLATLEALVRKWNATVNLVSKASLADLRRRHIADSAQLFDFVGAREGHWVDLGSGGGFPGLVIAILAADEAPEMRITCIESDLRKSAFLAAAARDLALPVTVLPQRIETAPPQGAQVVSARALAALPDLLVMAERHLAPEGVAVFPKGARHATEVAEARKAWTFTLTEAPSRTEPDARLLKFEGLARA